MEIHGTQSSIFDTYNKTNIIHQRLNKEIKERVHDELYFFQHFI